MGLQQGPQQRGRGGELPSAPFAHSHFPSRRTDSRTWTSSAPNPALPPVAPQTGLTSSPQLPPQATPRLYCHPPFQLLWSQAAFLPPTQAFCSPLDWPQLRPQRLSPQPPGTMAQLWAIAPHTSWMPSISFWKKPKRKSGRGGVGEAWANSEGWGGSLLSDRQAGIEALARG